MSSAAADQTLPLVRDSVRNVLTRSESFRALPPEDRRKLAHDMVKVARYIVDAGGETAGVPMQAKVATGLADPPPPDRSKSVTDITKNPASAGSQITGTPGKKGVRDFSEAIGKVDFPKFVGGLVEGVFNAIVTSSIRQMEAYSTMVANIAKSADQYMKDNVSENQARDYLAEKYPQHLQLDTSKGDPKLTPRKTERGRGGRGGGGGRDGGGGRGFSQSLAGSGPMGIELPDFQKDLGLPAPVSKLDPKTVEEQLVPAARKRIAMDRQQLLATMVLMGINRLVVTDGRISASCLFELDTSETAYQDTTSAADYDEHSRTRGSQWGFWFAPTTTTRASSNFKVSTTNDAGGEASTELHAELTGNVDINFRSDVVSLDKIADLLQIQEIQQKAPSAAAPAAPAAPAVNLPPPPPLPSLPGSPFAPPAPPATSG
jgi:hypothetical protein